jgi:hypothetical protein
MELADVTDAVREVPWMSPHQGAVIYRHIRETVPNLVLELGTAHGASAAYIAAALHENGTGHLTTVDRTGAGYNPSALLHDLGLPSALDAAGEGGSAQRVDGLRPPVRRAVWLGDGLRERRPAEAPTGSTSAHTRVARAERRDRTPPVMPSVRA